MSKFTIGIVTFVSGLFMVLAIAMLWAGEYNLALGLILLSIFVILTGLIGKAALPDKKIVPISRSVMEKGFAPHAPQAGRTWLGVGAISAIYAFIEWQTPSIPPFSGRLSWAQKFFYVAAGPRGLLAAAVAFACLSIICGLVLLWSNRR
jgi:hypothetical protein